MKIDAKTTIRRYLVSWYQFYLLANGVLTRTCITRVVDIYQDKDEDDDDVCSMQTVLMEEGCYGLATLRIVELN
jgi:hypothetical protein